jgi:hypothetical protein
MDADVNATVTIKLTIEMDEGDSFDPEAMKQEIRAFVSQYGPVESIDLEHDGIMEDDEEEDE